MLPLRQRMLSTRHTGRVMTKLYAWRAIFIPLSAIFSYQF